MFSAAMVRALLAGEKTQTRLLADKHRKVRLQRIDEPHAVRLSPATWRDTAVGDRLWVRESLGWDKAAERLFYRADGATVIAQPPPGQALAGTPLSALYMPRWAARLMLSVIAVRIERLQAIGEAEAIAEGIRRLADGRFRSDPDDPAACPSATLAYARRWSGFHTRPGTRWEDDPEVVVMSFEVARAELGAAACMPAAAQ